MSNNVVNYRTVPAYDGPPDEAPAVKPSKQKADHEGHLRQVEDWWHQARQAHSANRQEMAIDQDFVDGDQWSDEDKLELEQRGQPALTFNLIATSCRWISGTEKRTRMDFHVLPRGEEDREQAEAKTQLLKYLSDTSRSPFHVSRAFEDAVTAGVGWLEEGVRNDPTEEALFVRYESWRNIWHDHLAMEPDMRDGRYLFRAKWVDLDVALAHFPEHEDLLKAAAEDHDTMRHTDDEEFAVTHPLYPTTVSHEDVWHIDSQRQRVRLVECWYRVPERVKVLHGPGAYNGAALNEQDPRLMAAADTPDAAEYEAVRQIMRVMIFISGRQGHSGHVLTDSRSPYWHNRFPFTPVWGYRRKRDGMPYGVPRGMRDPQVDLNKRRSKALFILSTNRVVMDKGAVDDINVLADEAAAPDGIIEVNVGKKLQILNDTSLAREHVSLMGQSADYIQRVGGVTDENLGRQTNATSGKAIEARQDQGTTVTSDLFDNLRLGMQISGEKQLALVEQYYDEQKRIRILGDRGMVEFAEVNIDETNMITAAQADFVIDEHTWNASVRQQMFNTLMDLVSKLPPDVGLRLLDIVVEMSDVPMREELVARIRDINGMSAPDEEKSEEEQAAEQEQAEMQKRQVLAQLALLEGKAREAMAKGDRTAIEAMSKKIEAMQSALETAGAMSVAPHLAGPADALMEEAQRPPGGGEPTDGGM